jgi:D-3-phosphoglycerate dehydrogenase
MVADQIRAFLENGHIHNSVNFPEVNLPRTTPYRLVAAGTSRAALSERVSEALQRAGLTTQSMATVSRGDLVYSGGGFECRAGRCSCDRRAGDRRGY